jgi:hypothetical protein
MALAADPTAAYRIFHTLLETYKNSNGTTISFIVGKTPLIILWVAFAGLVLSSVCWLVCFVKISADTDTDEDVEMRELPQGDSKENLKIQEESKEQPAQW